MPKLPKINLWTDFGFGEYQLWYYKKRIRNAGSASKARATCSISALLVSIESTTTDLLISLAWPAFLRRFAVRFGDSG
jgi:hypothetical protein